MSTSLPEIYLARHGETAWTLSRQHTGLTDIPLLKQGENDAIQLGQRLKGWVFTKVLVSPLGRARRTCQLAGFGDKAEVDPELHEWDYGDYEGRRTADARLLVLSTAALSILGYEHNLEEPAILLWNDNGHVLGEDVDAT